jgi:hypothetical protein
MMGKRIIASLAHETPIGLTPADQRHAGEKGFRVRVGPTAMAAQLKQRASGKPETIQPEGVRIGSACGLASWREREAAYESLISLVGAQGFEPWTR